jgi:hypothetical protein
MTKEEIGIGIIDIYDQEDLDICYGSIPDEYKDNVFVVSSTNNTMVNDKYRIYGEVPMATLRNWLISQFRIQGYKYYFIFESNHSINENDFFEKTIKIAETFGSWFLLGDGKSSLPLEDEETNVVLHASPEMNSGFMFTFSGIIKNNGYFDERYPNTKDIDVLDYIVKLRKIGVYPPAHYNLTIGDGLKKSGSTVKKIGYKDFPETHRSVGLAYAYFAHKNKYLPGQNDPTGITQDQLLKFLETLQKNYATIDKK